MSKAGDLLLSLLGNAMVFIPELAVAGVTLTDFFKPPVTSLSCSETLQKYIYKSKFNRKKYQINSS